MLEIIDVIAAPALTGFYFDDQKAIKTGARSDGATYQGKPATEGFSQVRQAGEAISVEFILSDGSSAGGDCAAVQYSGAGGRDPLFLSQEFIPVIEGPVKAGLVGQSLESFRELADIIEKLEVEGHRLHTAIRYGLSQAALSAVAQAHNLSRTEVVAKEYDLELSAEAIPIFTQTGDDRYLNADKAIIKEARVLPHGLINNVADKLGQRGEKLLKYIGWLRDRIQQVGQAGYRPVLHIDVYGTIGEAFANDLKAMTDYILEAEKAASPFKLRLEGPMDAGNRQDQIELLAELTASLDQAGSTVELVADEWCNTLEDIKDFADNKAGHMIQIKTPDLGGIHNTIEAVLYCKAKGLGAYQGGTCNETDRSARVCTDIALATQPDQILAKPGMGLDEGLMIVNNQMQRTLRYLEWKKTREDQTKAAFKGVGR
ncbi:MAG: methylaspartate ammonia-lyase [Bacillota bacterium]